MHMSDSLLSPAVAGGMWAATAGTIAYCSAKVRDSADDSKIPLMGVLGAFLFAAQMINFSIPLTGSSGHLGGGLLLSILLGPYAAFLTIASVLFVQALFFADGGLLALGCNIFNLGFFPAFIGYPLVYRRMIGSHPGQARLTAATVVAAVIGLQLGAFAVVLETVTSGMTSLPFVGFTLLMQPIHLAIGLVEGFATAAIVSFVYKARPETIRERLDLDKTSRFIPGRITLVFLIATLFIGGVGSWYASQAPDGLEWAISRLTGTTEPDVAPQGIHQKALDWQKHIAFLPDYSFKPTPGSATSQPAGASQNLGTTVSGVVGGLITLGIVFVGALLMKKRSGSKP